MASLLRRAQSSLNVLTPPPPRGAKHAPLDSNEHGRDKFRLAEEVESNSQQDRRQEASSPFTKIRRKLVTKASTFSLRRKYRRTDLEELGQGTAGLHKVVPHELEQSRSCNSSDRGLFSTNGVADAPSLSLGCQHSEKDRRKGSAGCVTTQLPPSSSTSNINRKGVGVRAGSRPQIVSTAGLSVLHKEPYTNWSAMASESAVPPVPYERLKDIATEACDAALSGINSYTHASTESWNTTIINTILAALVKETTPTTATAGSTPQPRFKYVVNSTIIQHAAVSSAATEETGKVSGRRGMHSASGAYWNNEKDGMWSFKYEAAEKKGLDVVVGIIWVWVG